MHRTHTCGELRKEHIGETVTIAGWIQNKRDMGGLVFLDIRDRYGVTQVQFDPSLTAGRPSIGGGNGLDQESGDSSTSSEGRVDMSAGQVAPGGQVACGSNKRRLTEIVDELKFEYCVKITGEVVPRPDGQTNPDMATGEVEIHLQDIVILNTCKTLPYALIDEPATSEEQRLKHRYIDLRRRPVLNNIQFKAKMTHFTRNWFTDNQFLEVQTPIFTVSSPEGARDYLIPSRVNPGKFYAMPQAPQQYKQLLMVGGIDKYFQIAPCFRDEDPRADRHSCEFYQIDAEMSFVEQDDVLNVAQTFTKALVAELVPHKQITVDFIRLSYHDAMLRYGSDKPDLRFGMEIVDLSEELEDSEFGVFSKTISNGGVVRAIKLDQQSMTRKEIDELTEVAKHAGAGGLAYLIYENGEIRSPIKKFLSDAELEIITSKCSAVDGDMLFFGADMEHTVCKVLNKVRLALRDKYELVDDSHLAFAWIIDFPFYEYDEKHDSRDFGHNPFSHVVGGVDALKTKDFSEIETNQYDMVLNGYEILSGSIRNHDPKVMVAAFEKLGMSENEVKERFGAMYEAFQYGCPPHGGFAFGFDRLMMILCDEDNIRECYAFPKSGKAEDVMMGAPSPVDESQLTELSIEMLETE